MSAANSPTSRLASCSCGQLQAHVSGEPVRVSVCHCLACQRRTGSVFGAQARFPRAAVIVVGTSAEYVRVGDEGTRTTFRFCPTCGATVFYTGDDAGSIAIPVGAFADPSFPAPTVSVYEERMHSWVRMPNEMEHMP
ncbi:GFA family protein [Rhodanobacter sp. Si-c]|uniref:GFA family protein n=1 Tax=Rhodanobacter lycopersici TaxID=3162487 RepID=A0ABV3QDH4_9GAMM